MIGVIDGLEERREARARQATGSNVQGSSSDLAFTSTSNKRRRESSAPAQSSSPPYIIEPPPLDALDEYLELCGCSPITLELYKTRLMSAQIFDFRLINEKDTPLAKMEEIGFSEAVAKMMYKNAGKLGRKMVRERRAV